jgi:RNA polymerase sigma factor (sigma-70 family)
MSPPAIDAEPTQAVEISRAGLEHLDGLYHLARYLTRSADAAEELVQETFVRALAGARTFNRGSNARAWLFRILRNVFIDQRRRDKVSPIDASSAPDEEASDEPVEPLRGDVELERLRGIVAEDIAAAIRSLSPDARTIVLLDIEGFSEAELAEVLGCAAGTVKSRLSRARASLRERLQEYAK